MNRIFKLLLLLAALVFVAPHAWAGIACPTVTGNLVTNCSFETGDFSAWITTNAPTVVPGSAEDGTHMAMFNGTVGSESTISQSLTTIPGTSYTISFYLNVNSVNGFSNDAIVDFGGTQLTDLKNVSVGGWNEYSYTGVATSSSTVLEFRGANPIASFIDNVVVTPNAPAAPEPATWTLLAGGAFLVLGVGRRQYSSLRR